MRKVCGNGAGRATGGVYAKRTLGLYIEFDSSSSIEGVGASVVDSIDVSVPVIRPVEKKVGSVCVKIYIARPGNEMEMEGSI